MRYPTTDGHRATAQSQPNDQKQSHDCSRSYGDSLEKREKKNAQSHANIVWRSEGLDEITMVIVTTRDGPTWTTTVQRTVVRNCPGPRPLHSGDQEIYRVVTCVVTRGITLLLEGVSESKIHAARASRRGSGIQWSKLISP